MSDSESSNFSLVVLQKSGGIRQPPPPGTGTGSCGPWNSSSHVHKITYAPMIYTAQCVVVLMRANDFTWASGRGVERGNLEFFGPEMTLA